MLSPAFLHAREVLPCLGLAHRFLLAALVALPSLAQAEVIPFHCTDPSEPGDGLVTVWIGYSNYSGETITVPHGPNNYFAPPPSYRGQITEFLPGLHLRAFSVVHDPDGWFLDYVVNDVRRHITSDVEDYCASPVNALVITPSGVLFVGTADAGIFRSTDDAASWDAANAGLTDLHITALAVASDESAIYAGTRAGGVFKSVDGGFDWQPVGLDDLVIRTLEVHPADPSRLFAGTTNGVQKSADSGDTWQAMNSGLPPGVP